LKLRGGCIRNREYDEVRDKYFRELNYTVLRFKNEKVEEDIKEVVEKIKQYLM
jgi:very-short-patch-repair endonuclease